MTQISDAQPSMLFPNEGATAKQHPPVYAYHIYKRPANEHWRARYHRLIFREPVPYDEAVQSVLGGHSCYVEVDGLQTAIEQLEQLGVTVHEDTPGAGKR